MLAGRTFNGARNMMLLKNIPINGHITTVKAFPSPMAVNARSTSVPADCSTSVPELAETDDLTEFNPEDVKLSRLMLSGAD